MTQAQLSENLRTVYLNKLYELFKDDEIIRIASNEICLPCINANGDDSYITIKVVVPKGSKELPFDPYALNKEYNEHIAEQDAKKKAQAEIKARKIAKAEADKKAKAEARAKAKAEKENKQGV